MTEPHFSRPKRKWQQTPESREGTLWGSSLFMGITLTCILPAKHVLCSPKKSYTNTVRTTRDKHTWIPGYDVPTFTWFWEFIVPGRIDIHTYKNSSLDDVCGVVSSSWIPGYDDSTVTWFWEFIDQLPGRIDVHTKTHRWMMCVGLSHAHPNMIQSMWWTSCWSLTRLG